MGVIIWVMVTVTDWQAYQITHKKKYIFYVVAGFFCIIYGVTGFWFACQ